MKHTHNVPFSVRELVRGGVLRKVAIKHHTTASNRMLSSGRIEYVRIAGQWVGC
jgi:hypothetical protein